MSCMTSSYILHADRNIEITKNLNTQQIEVYIFIAISLMFLNPCMCVCRADTESTSEHLEALKKLASDLEEQRETLEDLRDQRQAILPRLSLLDKELVKQQVRALYFCYTCMLKWTRGGSSIETFG